LPFSALSFRGRDKNEKSKIMNHRKKKEKPLEIGNNS
jgi:hypothetical protein